MEEADGEMKRIKAPREALLKVEVTQRNQAAAVADGAMILLAQLTTSQLNAQLAGPVQTQAQMEPQQRMDWPTVGEVTITTDENVALCVEIGVRDVRGTTS